MASRLAPGAPSGHGSGVIRKVSTFWTLHLQVEAIWRTASCRPVTGLRLLSLDDNLAVVFAMDRCRARDFPLLVESRRFRAQLTCPQVTRGRMMDRV